MKQITINGINFELSKKPITEMPYYSGRRLEDCYNRPSYAKENIYEWWFNWFHSFDYENKIGYITVHSYNIMIFTLTMAVKFENKLYHLYITPSHNYAKEIQL